MGFLKRLRGTIVPSRTERQFEEEARFHLEELVDRYVADGLPPAEARRQAERRLGNLVALRDRTRDADTYRWLTDAARDLRFACRTLAKTPAFTVVAVLTLALGIGANTAIFTLFDAILLRDLPVRDPSRLMLFTDDPGEGTSTGSPPTGRWGYFSLQAYRYLRDLPQNGFDAIAAVRSGESTVLTRVSGARESTEALRAQAHLVSGNYFTTLGVEAALGRALNPADDLPGAPPAVVVSDGFWRKRLHSDPSIVGTSVILNRTAFTIVGVAPPEFFGERVRRPPDFWVPLVWQPQIELRPSMLEDQDAYWLNLIGRLAQGVRAEHAAAVATIGLRQFLTDQAGSKITADRKREIQQSYVALSSGAAGVSTLRVRYSRPLHMLFAVVGLVLLLACANVANLLLTRASARRGEIAVRIALGAGRSRLVRQLLTESMVIAALGGTCGALVAMLAVRGLFSLIAPSSTPVQAALNLPVLGFTGAVAVGAGVLFGLVPALQASRFDLIDAMKVRQAAGSIAGGSVTKTLVAIQVALSMVLLAGSVLFARTLTNLEAQPLGFDAAHVLLVRVSPRLAGYTPATATAMYLRAYDRLRALPGIRSVSFARYSPFSGSNSVNSGTIEGYKPRAGEDIDLETIQVGPSYPDTLGVSLREGRAPGVKDVAGAPLVAMVNEAFARRYVAGSSPLGRHFTINGAAVPNVEIVGVVRDVQFHDARKPVPPAVFPAMLQESSRFALDCEFELRTDGDPTGAIPEVRQALAEIAPDVPQNDPVLLGSQVASAFDSDRLAARFVMFFGALALTLACVGVYGTIAQSVTRRTAEIGLRMALGAPAAAVLWLVVRQTALLLGAGLLAGLPFALLGGRLVRSLLYGVDPVDPISLGGAATMLVIVAGAASMIPALRATRISAVQALRSD
jgi:predicted permease